MDLIEQAFQKLYPQKEFNYSAVLKYSGKFKGYNARVQLDKFTQQLTFKLSNNWKTVSTEIQTGLIQSLFCRILKQPAHSMQMELYELFIKNLPDTLPRTKTHPLLEESFKRVNEKYFAGLMLMPNFGLKESVKLLGTYEYSTDTISITQMLLEHPELLDYVMYHELLHKKHKFSSKNGRQNCHTKVFRDEERKFENWQMLEKQLGQIVRKHAVRRFFNFF